MRFLLDWGLNKGHNVTSNLRVVTTIIFMIKKVNGAVFYGMILTAILGVATGLIDTPKAVVPSLEPTFGVALTHFGDILQFKWGLLL